MATNVVLLGTGTPRTEPGRSGPAAAVIVDGRPYLFDFGPGVGRRIADGHESGINGLAMSGFDRAFLSHMHSDHTIGLADVMLTPWMFGRKRPLEVYGPQGTAAMTRSLSDAYSLDVAKRKRDEPHTEGGHQIQGCDVVPGVVYRDDLVTVEAFAVQHGDWPEECGPYPALGYRVRSSDRTVVVSGDTGPYGEMQEHYAGCDVLVHEVYASRGLESRPAEWRRYHARSHTAGSHLGQVATAVQPGTLVLTHQLLWHASEDDVIDEIRDGYEGELVYGRDLSVV